MTTTRQELENKLAAFAAAQVPPVAVAYEGRPFTRPSNATDVLWIQCFVKTGSAVSATVDASTIRTRGTWLVNCYRTSGYGTGKLETLVQGIMDTFPVVPKSGNVSIESPGNSGNVSVTADGWICIPVSFPYRVESLA